MTRSQKGNPIPAFLLLVVKKGLNIDFISDSLIPKPVSVIKILIIDKLFPGWAQNMALVVSYSFIMVILWFLLLILWNRNGKIGSFDWMTGKIKETVRYALSNKEFKRSIKNSKLIVDTRS